jgi:hypothetical protein
MMTTSTFSAPVGSAVLMDEWEKIRKIQNE